MTERKRMIVGISGASGAVYGLRILEALKELGLESHLVLSRAGAITAKAELDIEADSIWEMADFAYDVDDIGAAPASGSFKSLGMIVVPCSIKSLSEIAAGTTSSLLTRAADVTLKERRRLVLMVRETPLHVGHLRSMLAVSEMGAVVAPPVPSFYAKPESISEMVDHTVGRALDLFGLDWRGVKRWSGIKT
jgi:4-hydroxy-3-polyprenylbenzoate decarboxylase